MDRNPILKVLEGTLQGEAFEVTAEGLMLGRGEDCAVRLSDPGVSREHARVFLHNAGVWVQDMGSRNGVFVKGTRIVRPKQVSPGTRFQVGDHFFTIELTEGPPPKPPAEPIEPVHEGPTQITPMEPTVSEPAPTSKLPLTLGIVGVLLVLGLIAATLLSG